MMQRRHLVSLRYLCGMIALNLSFGLVCFAQQTGATVTRAESVKQEISGVIKAYEKALNAGDTAAVMGLYSTSPVFVPPNSKGVTGRDGVKSAYEGLFSAIKLSPIFTVHEVVEQGDTAWVRTSSEGEVEILANKSKVKDANNELFIVRKEQGQWKIHRYVFNSAMPATGK